MFDSNIIINGGLAQLARAPRWQRGGHRFESDILHNKTTRWSAGGFLFERMKKRRLYSTDAQEIEQRIGEAGLIGVFAGNG